MSTKRRLTAEIACSMYFVCLAVAAQPLAILSDADDQESEYEIALAAIPDLLERIGDHRVLRSELVAINQPVVQRLYDALANEGVDLAEPIDLSLLGNRCVASRFEKVRESESDGSRYGEVWCNDFVARAMVRVWPETNTVGWQLVRETRHFGVTPIEGTTYGLLWQIDPEYLLEIQRNMRID